VSGKAVSWVLANDPPERDADWRVLVVLASHAKDDGSEARPKVPTIMRESRLQRAAVYGALNRLEATNRITRAGKRGKSTVWRVTMSSETVHLDGQTATETVHPGGRKSPFRWNETVHLDGLSKDQPSLGQPSINRPTTSRAQGEPKKDGRVRIRTVPCPRCRAPIGELCLGLANGLNHDERFDALKVHEANAKVSREWDGIMKMCERPSTRLRAEVDTPALPTGIEPVLTAIVEEHQQLDDDTAVAGAEAGDGGEAGEADFLL
jgi:hypothetical protein